MFASALSGSVDATKTSASKFGIAKPLPYECHRHDTSSKPRAMQVYRPYRAPLRLPYHFIILMRLLWVKETDRLTGIKMLLSLRRLIGSLDGSSK